MRRRIDLGRELDALVGVACRSRSTSVGPLRNCYALLEIARGPYDYNGGFGHLLVMGQAGFLDNKETVRGIELLAREIYPRLKELK